MSGPNQFLSETHIIGQNCSEHFLDSDRFPELRNAPFVWLGYSVLESPYRIVRLRSIYSHIVVSMSGTARTLIDGQVVDWSPGQVLLAPVGAHHGFEIGDSGPWEIAWVFFDDTPASPVLKTARTALINADYQDFTSTLKMLLREAAGPAQPTSMTALVTLLNTYACRMAGIEKTDMRLWRLWEKVEANLSHPWTSQEMAKIAHVSEEHLRRLCHEHYQESPMKHLTFLRINRASLLLKSAPDTIECIANRVGYSSTYSFSTAFKRWIGKAPGKFKAENRDKGA